MPLMVWIVRKTLPSSGPAVRLLLQCNEVLVELVQVLVTLDEELMDDLVHLVHWASSISCTSQRRQDGGALACIHPSAECPYT